MGHRVSAALCHKRGMSAIRLPGATSIFNAELHAILLALDVVQRSKEKHFLLLSDSYSSLIALGVRVCFTSSHEAVGELSCKHSANRFQ